jgi:hypothetical protein
MSSEQPSTGGRARFDRYAKAKDLLAGALGDYLAAVVEIGGEDSASSLELARQLLVRDLHGAVDGRLCTVTLTDVWADMVDRSDRAGERLDRE